MVAVDDLDEVIKQCQLALDEFARGSPKPMQRIISHKEDVSLANSFGPSAHGWEQVAATMDRAASNLRLYPKTARLSGCGRGRVE
jgi:hypothetical protein